MPKKIDPGVLVQMRLYPDMFPLSQQVQIASDMAKGCAARLAGQEPPKYEDTETTFPELKARLAKTIAFLRTFTPDQIDGTEERQYRTELRAQDADLSGFTLSLVFRAAQLLFPHHDRLRYPAPWRRSSGRWISSVHRRGRAGAPTSRHALGFRACPSRKAVCVHRVLNFAPRSQAASLNNDGVDRQDPVLR